MYFLFRYKRIMPSEYYHRKSGEKKIIQAFMHYEIEQRNNEIESLGGD